MISHNMKKKKYNRYTALIFVSVAIFCALLLKLIVMQIVDHQYYLDQCNNDSVKGITEPGPRGDIVDRNGIVLAKDIQSYVLTFMETEESKRSFFDTLEKVFKALDNKAEIQSDTFPLKTNPFKFDFNTEDAKASRNAELRFKKDRGLDEAVIHNIKSLDDKRYKDLSLSQQTIVDEALLKITPEETFNLLWKQYTDWYFVKKNNVSEATKDKMKNYSIDEKRRFMLILDALKIQSFSGYKPVEIANIKRDTAFAFQEKFNELPGIDIIEKPKRFYPYNDLASGVLGNLSRISPDKQKKYEEKGYDVNTDLIGVSGIEGVLESRLKGTKGEKLVEVNKMGRTVKEKAKSEPFPGQKIQLTIDKNIQSIGEKALDKALKAQRDNPRVPGSDVDTSNANRGAVAVLNVNTGEVLALVSRPGFDPNMFAIPGKESNEFLKQYNNPDYEKLGRDYIRQRNLLSLKGNEGFTEDQLLDKLFPVDTSNKSDKPVRKDMYDIFPKPLFNYATSSLIPPGSSFKPVTGVAGLETGTITQYETYNDQAFYDDGKGGPPIWFHADGANGVVDMKKAIAKSSNPYFMDLGRKLKDRFGDDILAEYAWKYGLGVKPNSGTNPSTGIEIPESFGQVYNVWSNKNRLATSYSINTMIALKSGKDYRDISFPPIDLYDNSNDTKEVKKIKRDIINMFKDSIRNGTFDTNAYKNILKKLVDMDESYKGKTFKNSDYDKIINEISHITVSTAYSESTMYGNIYNASIGQGTSLFTPLQLADYVATLVNGGNRYKVHLVNKIFDADGTLVEEKKPEVLNTTGVSQSTIEVIKAGMGSVTTEGTAAGAFESFKSFMQTGGKTGSATFREQDQDAMGRTSYSFFVGFAPYDNPEIAVCAVMFDGGYGSSVAPVVRAVYEAYFKDKLKSASYVPPDDFVQEFYSK